MKKRLILRWVFLAMLLGYGIWRMRPLRIPSYLGSEEDLKLDLLPQIPKEENLGYTFQLSWVKELDDVLKPLYDNSPFSRWESAYVLSDFHEIKAIKLHHNKMWYGDQKIEEVEKGVVSGYFYDISFEEYFSGLQMEQFLQKLDENWELSRLITAIHTQEWVADSFFPFGGANYGYGVAQHIGNFLEQAAFYSYQKWDLDQGKKYLESALLLYLKLSKYNSESETSITLSKLNFLMQDILYFAEQQIIPKHHLQAFKQLWEAYPLDQEKSYQQELKWKYQASLWYLNEMKNMTGDMAWLMKYPFLDVKETKAVLTYYFLTALDHPTSGHKMTENFLYEKLDGRSQSDVSQNMLQLTQDNFYSWYFIEHIWKPLKPYLWRKNKIWMDLFCSIWSWISNFSVVESVQKTQALFTDFIAQD